MYFMRPGTNEEKKLFCFLKNGGEGFSQDRWLHIFLNTRLNSRGPTTSSFVPTVKMVSVSYFFISKHTPSLYHEGFLVHFHGYTGSITLGTGKCVSTTNCFNYLKCLPCNPSSPFSQEIPWSHDLHTNTCNVVRLPRHPMSTVESGDDEHASPFKSPLETQFDNLVGWDCGDDERWLETQSVVGGVQCRTWWSTVYESL